MGEFLNMMSILSCGIIGDKHIDQHFHLRLQKIAHKTWNRAVKTNFGE